MALATLTARVDESDKSAFDSFCNSVGLTTSAAINIYVKAVLRERRIPFDIKQEDPFYSASNQAYIMKSVAELKAGKGTPHELIEVIDSSPLTQENRPNPKSVLPGPDDKPPPNMTSRRLFWSYSSASAQDFFAIHCL